MEALQLWLLLPGLCIVAGSVVHCEYTQETELGSLKNSVLVKNRVNTSVMYVLWLYPGNMFCE